MKLTTYLTLAAGLLTASAAPTAQQLRQFTMIAARSTSPIHLRSIDANGNKFWIGKPTTAECPITPKSECPPKTNETQFGDVVGYNTLGLETEVPAGQSVFIDVEDGSMSFNSAHTEVPSNAIAKPFTFTHVKDSAPQGELSLPGSQIACPAGEDVYQVFSEAHYKGKVEKCECLVFDLLTTKSDAPPAFQFV